MLCLRWLGSFLYDRLHNRNIYLTGKLPGKPGFGRLFGNHQERKSISSMAWLHETGIPLRFSLSKSVIHSHWTIFVAYDGNKTACLKDSLVWWIRLNSAVTVNWTSALKSFYLRFNGWGKLLLSRCDWNQAVVVTGLLASYYYNDSILMFEYTLPDSSDISHIILAWSSLLTLLTRNVWHCREMSSFCCSAVSLSCIDDLPSRSGWDLFGRRPAWRHCYPRRNSYSRMWLQQCWWLRHSLALWWYTEKYLTIDRGIETIVPISLSNRLSVIGNVSKEEFTLRIENVQEADSGVYYCAYIPE